MFHDPFPLRSVLRPNEAPRDTEVCVPGCVREHVRTRVYRVRRRHNCARVCVRVGVHSCGRACGRRLDTCVCVYIACIRTYVRACEGVVPARSCGERPPGAACSSDTSVVERPEFYDYVLTYTPSDVYTPGVIKPGNI